MKSLNKNNLQTLLILGIAIIFLACLSMITATGIQPQIVVAQEPPPSPEALIATFSEEELAAYGISLEDIQAAASFDLQVSVTASPASITSGGSTNFTTKITNLGTDSAQYILFSQTVPTGMTAGTPVFGPGVTAIGNGSTPTAWLLTNSIASGSAVTVTVPGTISSNCNTTVQYSSSAYPYNTASDTTLTNNTATAAVTVNGGGNCMYLPVIRRDPTPTPTPTPNAVFYDNFSNENWTVADKSGYCNRSYEDGEYQIKAQDEDYDCFSAAPDDAEQENGVFKVTAYRSSGGTDFTVAIYVNGDGGDTYYALEVRPYDNCGWKLIQNDDGDTSTKRSGSCASAINRYSAKNILELKRLSNGNISAYVNGTQLGTTYSGDDDFGGEGVGIYARSNDSDDVTLRFDDFTVQNP